ncbi:hypothetical protein ABIE44_003562 [Marmoricola sp. OAE513]|uniref:DUF1905 domain-containing protein n=1 Tax=Marmoricola sp. OAE513 TaxID=2817894 RepID=UPI001E1853BB
MGPPACRRWRTTLSSGEVVEFTAELFLWSDGGWYFVRLPVEAAEEVRDLVTAPPTGFGSVRVEVTIGTSRWRTSVFPDKASGSFLLPVKKPVRVAEGIDDGDEVRVLLEVTGD